MPWYRRNSADHPTNPLDWVTIANLYRRTSSGNWEKLRRAYRKNSGTGSPPYDWIIVHDSDSLKPYVTVAPTLTSNYGSDSIFEDGDIITLTRGTWANTSSGYNPVSYSLKIQYSSDNINWTDAVTGTGTSISYTIALTDVRSPSYYFRGRVTATNTHGSSTFNTPGVLSNMYLTVDSFSASIVNNQIYSVWTLNKSNNTSNIYEQRYSIITNSTYTYNGITYYAGQTVYETTVPVGTNSFMVPTGTNIKPGESHYAKLVVTANDTIGSEAFGFSSNFLAPFVPGTISITPSFDALNGNRRVESGSTVTAVPENWPSGTTFTYEWYRTRAFSLQDDIFLGTGSTTNITTSSSTTGERIYVNAYATYSNGQTASVVFSEYHRIIPAPPVYTLGGGGSSITITSLTAVGGESYFGTYSGPTSGSIPDTAIGTDYTIPNLSTGTYTITLYSRAVNGSGASLTTTESNSGTSLVKSITALTAPTSVSATYSGGTFYVYHSGGSGPYYQVWWNTSTSPGVNNPTTLGVTGYDFSGSSSPVTWTPSAVSPGTTYNFWVRSSNSLTTTTAGDYSPWSTVYGQATPPLPTAPTITSVSSGNAGGPVTVYFTGGSGPYYQLYWTTATSAPSSAVTPDAEGSSSPLTDSTGPGSAGFTYYAYVRSVTSLGETSVGPSSVASAWSSGYAFTVTNPNATPPTSVNAFQNSSSSITVYWSGATNATKYRIWWSTVSTGNGVDPSVSYDAETTNTIYTFNGLSASTTYYFWVSAANSNNVWTSYSLSPRAQATTASAGVAPSTPTGLSNSYSSGPSWTGSWSASSGTPTITYYWTLYQSQSNGGSITATASGSTTGTSFSRSMSSSNGLWAYFTVFASNSFGTSGTATSPWA